MKTAVSAIIVMLVSVLPAFGDPVTPTDAILHGALTSGPLSGTPVDGTFSYDSSAVTGVGHEFISLLSFDVDVLGTHFTRADIDQGGQVLFQSGVLETVTAAFFPPPPVGAPVSDIAFGFGGPGVIGYVAGALGEFGGGSFEVATIATTPEPSTTLLVVTGLLLVSVWLAATRTDSAS